MDYESSAEGRGARRKAAFAPRVHHVRRRSRIACAATHHLPQPSLEQNFAAFEGVPLVVPPDGVLPSGAYLATHRKTIFRAS